MSNKIDVNKITSVRIIRNYDGKETVITDSKVINELFNKYILTGIKEILIFPADYRLLINYNGEEINFLVHGNVMKYKNHAYRMQKDINSLLDKLLN